MPPYTVRHAYAAYRDGRKFGPWRTGEVVDLTTEEAAMVNADSPGALAPPARRTRPPAPPATVPATPQTPPAPEPTGIDAGDADPELKASGGPVQPDGMYLVGEAGPEPVPAGTFAAVDPGEGTDQAAAEQPEPAATEQEPPVAELDAPADADEPEPDATEPEPPTEPGPARRSRAARPTADREQKPGADR